MGTFESEEELIPDPRTVKNSQNYGSENINKTNLVKILLLSAAFVLAAGGAVNLFKKPAAAKNNPDQATAKAPAIEPAIEP